MTANEVPIPINDLFRDFKALPDPLLKVLLREFWKCCSGKIGPSGLTSCSIPDSPKSLGSQDQVIPELVQADRRRAFPCSDEEPRTSTVSLRRREVRREQRDGMKRLMTVANLVEDPGECHGFVGGWTIPFDYVDVRLERRDEVRRIGRDRHKGFWLSRWLVREIDEVIRRSIEARSS